MSDEIKDKIILEHQKIGKIFNGIKEGDIVRIKFKTIEELTLPVDYNDNNKLTQAERYHRIDTYGIGENIKALMQGGDFVVISTSNIDESDPNGYVYLMLDNHIDGEQFHVYKNFIESIEVIEAANKFVSEEHGIIMIQVGDKIYINGQLLENCEHDMYHPSNTDEDRRGDLDKFLAFMEQFVIDSAMAKELGGDE